MMISTLIIVKIYEKSIIFKPNKNLYCYFQTGQYEKSSLWNSHTMVGGKLSGMHSG